MFFLLILLGLPSQTLTDCAKAKNTDEEQAKAWLLEYNTRASEVTSTNNFLWWDYYANMTEHNRQLALENNEISDQFEKESVENASCFDWEQFVDPTTKREFSKIVVYAPLDDSDRKRLSDIRSKLTNIYNKGKVCGRPADEDASNCYILQPDLTRIFSESRDWEDLTWAWKGWRDATGKLMKEDYAEHIDILNKEAKLIGYSDASESLMSLYENDNFEQEISDLFKETMDLYKPLHTYVKNKLKKMYPNQEFPSSGHIPAHILGDNWAQDWASLIDEELIIPYPGRTKLDITNALIEKNFTVTKIYKTAEEFFMSLGFDPLAENFWTESLIERPSDREVECHGSAWDLFNAKDFRISFCTEISHRDFMVVHHEIGHIYYFMEYKDQPLTFRDGASPAVHEAIGDLILLSAGTPGYLHSIGLLDNPTSQYEDTINYLMLKALDNTAFIPFGYLVDQWRWDVLKGKIKPENYNAAWWDLRCRLQGVSPPVVRTEDDFDPGAKYHIANDSPYIRYFLSFVLMFQYQKALCDEANFEGPLHECNLFNSKVAGKKLRDVMKLGSSKPFSETLMMIANTDKLSAQPLVEYFQPLVEWLEQENQGMEQGWDDACPEGLIQSSSSTSIHVFYPLNSLAFILVCLCCKFLNIHYK